METAKIRHAGYPIRHSFNEFVDRYRCLVPNIQPSYKGDTKASCEKICSTVFGVEHDYQIGHTKVFLRNAQENYLEEKRLEMIKKSLLILQRNVRKWYYRRRFLKLKEAAIVFQKHWRARGYQSRYQKMRNGYLRLQAKLMQRQLTKDFKSIRSKINPFTAVCKGYLFRRDYKKKLEERKKKMEELLKLKQKEEAELKKKGQKNYKEISEQNYRNRLNNIYDTNLEDDSKPDTKIIDELLQGLDEYLDKNDKQGHPGMEKSSYQVS